MWTYQDLGGDYIKQGIATSRLKRKLKEIFNKAF
jgi:hypothetical protein